MWLSEGAPQLLQAVLHGAGARPPCKDSGTSSAMHSQQNRPQISEPPRLDAQPRLGGILELPPQQRGCTALGVAAHWVFVPASRAAAARPSGSSQQ